ncbi:MAG: hypothetical protein FWB75_06025, partial [Oscillospiraceae bacterium]|nr:hypothetical protein [Oscillospiraceae bacterium]
MKNLLSRSCAVLLVLVVLVGIPMVAFAELDAGGASGISGVASLTRTELEAMENEFFGPEGIEVLEIQLASLQGQWAVVNEQLLSIDADLVAAREAGHESGRRVRNEEDRVQRGRAASESQGFGIYAQAGSTESLGGELEAELGRARSMQRRLQAQEQAREEVLETLLAIEASIDGVHDAINQAWYNFDLAHSHMEEAEYNDEPDDVYYAGDERESCEHEYDEC